MGSRTIAHRFYVMDTEAFDFVLGTDFFVQHSQIQSLTVQAPYLLYVDHGSGRESVPLEQSEHTSSYLRLSKEEPSNMMAASKMKVLPWVVDGAGGLGAGKTSGAGTRGVSLDVVIGGRTGYSNTNGGESSDNRSKVHADCYPAENPSL